MAFDYAGSQPFTGVISGTGAMQLINGTLVLSTAQTYTGLTTITAGTLMLTRGRRHLGFERPGRQRHLRHFPDQRLDHRSAVGHRYRAAWRIRR